MKAERRLKAYRGMGDYQIEQVLACMMSIKVYKTDYTFIETSQSDLLRESSTSSHLIIDETPCEDLYYEDSDLIG